MYEWRIYLNIICTLNRRPLHVFIFKMKFKFSQRYIAKKIGAACNSRIPQANLHAGLNFVHAKKIAVIILFIFEIFVS